MVVVSRDMKSLPNLLKVCYLGKKCAQTDDQSRKTLEGY